MRFAAIVAPPETHIVDIVNRELSIDSREKLYSYQVPETLIEFNKLQLAVNEAGTRWLGDYLRYSFRR